MFWFNELPAHGGGRQGEKKEPDSNFWTGSYWSKVMCYWKG